MHSIVLVSGGFDPLHSGHIEYLQSARQLGIKLIVALNSDEWLTRKKGRPFLPFKERKKVLESISVVDQVIEFDDSNDSANDAIHKVLSMSNNTTICFANGGDRTEYNSPEFKTYGKEPLVWFAWNIGGGKSNSSSWILQEWKAPKTNRPWGYYRVVHESGREVKVKELIVAPGQRLSMQKHKDRSEHWFVDSGTATVYTLNASTDEELHGVYTKHKSLEIPAGMWHMLVNESDEPLKLVEIQYGTNCNEEDIERRD